MNIDEVLNYAPSLSVIDEETDNGPSTSKKRKLGFSSSNSQLSQEDIQKIIADSSTGNELKEVNEADLKRLISQFERRLTRNQEMRIKHADNPAKFMDSELELFDTIKEMHTLSTYPSLYEFFINQNAVPKLLGLLSHENTDIACAVVALIEELTDLEDIEEISQVGRLIEELIEHQIVLLLVNNMERLDENVKEESNGIHNSLGIIENLTDYKPDLRKDVKQLISWLLKKLKSKPIFYPNKLYASEILNILLANNEQSRIILSNLNGIDILLQVASYYKRHDPSDENEEEFVANLFNCLCSSVQACYKNRELFYKGEGLELMNLILKEKRKKESNTDVRQYAFKLLNHSLCTDKPDQLLSLCCDKFVEILGLRVLMPIFQKPNSILGHRNKRKQTSIDDVEEHSLCIILALMRFCKPENLKRVINKFVESNMIKTERLVELYFKYAERVVRLDQALQQEGYRLEDDEVKEQLYPQRLDGGLFVLQLVCHLLLLLASQEDAKGFYENKLCTTKERIIKLLHMHRHTAPPNSSHIEQIKQIVLDYAKEKIEIEATELIELVNRF